MKARFLWATVIVLILLSLPALVLAQPPVVSSTEPLRDGVGGVPMASPGALWDQPSDGYLNLASQYLPDYGSPPPSGFYSADDFANAQPWNIERIFVAGNMNYPGGLLNANSLNWLIYPDVAGQPAGYPDIGGDFWSYSCLPTAPEVTLGGANSDDITLDIVQAQGGPLCLPPGTYWLCFYPSLDFYPYGQWFWETAGTTNLAIAEFIDPQNIFGIGPFWTPWSIVELDPTLHDLAFRLEGTKLLPNVKYLHSTDGLFNLTAPIGTQWHELWPIFCREYHLSSWEDNGDGVLSPSDQIDMYQKPDGDVRWYHVDEVTITLFVMPAENGLVDSGFGRLPLGQPMYIELEGGYNASVLTAPNSTQWREIYPNFCGEYEITGWEDNTSGELDLCDYIWLRNKCTGMETYWHVEEVAVDITVTIKPPPVGGEAYPVNKISLLAPWIGLAVLLAGGTGWFTLRRRRTQS